MQKKIRSALISVFYKDGLESIVKKLHNSGAIIYSTGGTHKFIESLGIPCVPVESLTGYPSILGGRVKTLHPAVFGGILGRRDNENDRREMAEFKIPEIDLVIVDLYPFEETVANTTDDQAIIEKIDIGGPSMIRAAAKNHKDVAVIASKKDYPLLEQWLDAQEGAISLEQRRILAAKAFNICSGYDIAISNYFNHSSHFNPFQQDGMVLRYGENPHQQGIFYGDLEKSFHKLHGKDLSYNNLVDADAAMQLIREFSPEQGKNVKETIFAIIKHCNVCGIASRKTLKEAWDAALAGDPESAFGGVLICNASVDKLTAEAINEIFFEVLIADSFDSDALQILMSKKNRILLERRNQAQKKSKTRQMKSILNGVLSQDEDEGNFAEWKEVGGRNSNESEKEDLIFANIICKHLKSNAIALVKNKQLVGKGCGQTSRIDALRQAVEKAKQFQFDLNGSVMASDAFFPFNDCVILGHEAGVAAVSQPRASIRDKDSIDYCKEHQLAMVFTGLRHFRH